MISTLDPTAVYTAMITMLGLVLSTLGVAVVNLRGSRKRGQEAKQGRDSIKAQLTPTNGYDSLGDGLQAIEDKLSHIDERLQEGDDRFVRIEGLLSKHLNEVDPVLARALPLMERVERMQAEEDKK